MLGAKSGGVNSVGLSSMSYWLIYSMSLSASTSNFYSESIILYDIDRILVQYLLGVNFVDFLLMPLAWDPPSESPFPPPPPELSSYSDLFSLFKDFWCIWCLAYLAGSVIDQALFLIILKVAFYPFRLIYSFVVV